MDIKRITSIVLGFPLVVLVLTFGNKYVVDVFLAGVAFLGMQEYFNAIAKDSKPVRWLGYLYCFSIALIHVLPEHLPKEKIETIIILGIFFTIFILFAQVVFSNMKTNFKDIAYTFFGMVYVIGFISFIALIRGLQNGIVLIWYAIIAAWGTDIFAYIIGKKYGKHKFSKVSPKKSIEGCIAGTIGATIIALIYTFTMSKFGYNYSYIVITVITIILSIIGQLGDFSASSIKRYVDVKDYSNLIPGHGGMLDRIDSLMFLAPLAYILLKMI